ncbi:MAG: hypothetical protein Q9187_002004 [Circinaria calcarea]
MAQKIPLIGHIIGLLRQKLKYYVLLRQQNPLDIYTMAMPGSKLYIVNSPELISSIQRHSKTLAFPPIEAKFAMTVCGSSKEANDILNINVNGDEGDWGYSVEFYKSLHPALAPGVGLNSMNRIMVQNIAASLGRLKGENDKPIKIGLVQWLRHEITMATTNAVYGPMNPFKDPKVEDAFWLNRAFESDLVMIMMNVVPSITARKGCSGRALVSRAFEDYFGNKGHELGSVLVQNRYATSTKFKIPLTDIARYEVGGAIAVLVNTAPAAFWMLYHTFAYPDVLNDLRREVTTIMALRCDNDGTVTRSLDITSVKTNCPLLTSTFQEVLRVRTMGTSVRQVMQDTLLNDQYLLKKDSTILMPTLVVHTDPFIWGSDVGEFNHKRFMKAGACTKVSGGKRPNPAAFRAFGGGATLCPGRHFATTEVLAVVVMFIMRYEITPLNGRWVPPTTENSNIAAAIMEPDGEIEVEVTTRKGYEEGAWAFGLADSEMIFAVTAEDQAD